MATEYDVLVPWVAAHPGTADEQWSALNEKSITQLVATPISLRTLMANLNPTEYTIARTVLNTAAQSSLLIADALAIMANVGVWEESGLDIASDNARLMVDTLFTGDYAAIGAKIKGLAETLVSQIEAWVADGIIVQRGHLESARNM